jgi:hypothetical protein
MASASQTSAGRACHSVRAVPPVFTKKSVPICVNLRLSAVSGWPAHTRKDQFMSSNVTKCHQMSSPTGIHPMKFDFRCGNGPETDQFLSNSCSSRRTSLETRHSSTINSTLNLRPQTRNPPGVVSTRNQNCTVSAPFRYRFGGGGLGDTAAQRVRSDGAIFGEVFVNP